MHTTILYLTKIAIKELAQTEFVPVHNAYCRCELTTNSSGPVPHPSACLTAMGVAQQLQTPAELGWTTRSNQTSAQAWAQAHTQQRLQVQGKCCTGADTPNAYPALVQDLPAVMQNPMRTSMTVGKGSQRQWWQSTAALPCTLRTRGCAVLHYAPEETAGPAGAKAPRPGQDGQHTGAQS